MNVPLTRRTFVQQLGAAGAALAAMPAMAAANEAEPAGKTILAVVGCAHSHTPGYIQILKTHKDVRAKDPLNRNETTKTGRWMPPSRRLR